MEIEINNSESVPNRFAIIIAIAVLVTLLCIVFLILKNNNSVYATEFSNNVTEVTVESLMAQSINVSQKIEVIEEDIPYETVSIGSNRSGTGTVLVEGDYGTKRVVYKNIYENDKLVSQEEIFSSIMQEPASQVISYATKKTTSSRSNSIQRGEGDTNIPVASYTKVIKMRYTAYCLCPKCCGKSPSNPSYGLTAIGYRITPGQNDKVVAVDPKVVKLGSTVYVQGLDSKGDYGYAYACDTGGAIKGNRIDLYYDYHNKALQIGTGYCNVYVLD